ncbi:MAG: diadenylate cyclase CdaA [Lactobacillales bacterium]|jgi:diadenylate cyclase|nr:diadenylate cyclase CdaA [Lactobacillales bacterium]
MNFTTLPSNVINFLESIFRNFWSWPTLVNIIDLLIVWFFITQIIKIVKDTQAWQIAKGIIPFFILKLVAQTLGFQTVNYIIDLILNSAVVILVIIFQPEIRRFLESFGKEKWGVTTIARKAKKTPYVIGEIDKTATYLAKRKIGALMVFEGETLLGEYVETGIKLDADLSSELLINIFIPNTPLHDGAAIIGGDRILSASSFLPLTQNPDIDSKFGTRHRAAIGLSEKTDALIVVVSEESGKINIAQNGVLTEDVSSAGLMMRLASFLPSDDEPTSVIGTIKKGVRFNGK